MSERIPDWQRRGKPTDEELAQMLKLERDYSHPDSTWVHVLAELVELRRVSRDAADLCWWDCGLEQGAKLYDVGWAVFVGSEGEDPQVVSFHYSEDDACRATRRRARELLRGQARPPRLATRCQLPPDRGHARGATRDGGPHRPEA